MFLFYFFNCLKDFYFSDWENELIIPNTSQRCIYNFRRVFDLGLCVFCWYMDPMKGSYSSKNQMTSDFFESAFHLL